MLQEQVTYRYIIEISYICIIIGYTVCISHAYKLFIILIVLTIRRVGLTCTMVQSSCIESVFRHESRLLLILLGWLVRLKLRRAPFIHSNILC